MKAQHVIAFPGRHRRATPRPVAIGHEQDIVRGSLELLRVRGILAWRQNQGAMRQVDARGRERFVRFAGIKGISDIIGILPGGRFLAVECKVPGNLPTEEQIEFLDAIARRGGLVIVAYDIADLAEIVDRELGRSR